MSVRVRLFGLLRKAYGKNEILIELNGVLMLKDLIYKITEESPSLKHVLIDPELMDPRPNTVILVNGIEVSALNGLETEIKDGDEVVLIPVIHGGKMTWKSRRKSPF
jgi:molybdopterin synthase sulfur carrier subunit